MLPFMRKKPVAGLIISQRKPDGGAEEQHESGGELQELEMHMESLIRALSAKDSKAAAEAFKAAFDCCESYPHDEEPSEDSEASQE